MATAADIPPELFRRILLDVCEDADRLLYLSRDVPDRKERIKNIAACSLTCAYWAHICRWELFHTVWIKNYQDMHVFSSLVANTPKRFTPISKCVGNAILVQRAEDRPWIHLLRLQPSLFRCRDSARIRVHLHIEDGPNDAVSSRQSTGRRLFASLPRIPPSSCFLCDYLLIDMAHFVTPRDLTSLVAKFIPTAALMLTNVTWDARFKTGLTDLLTRDPIRISFTGSFALVNSSLYTVEAAWLAFVTSQRCLVRQASTVSLNPLAPWFDGSLTIPVLHVLPSAQRVILDICKPFAKTQDHRVPLVAFQCDNIMAKSIAHKDICAYPII
ncbi:hypothetical protein BC629DRAFT_236032 [Irpex lacteus]|nr:hypothetical protein BC629DRAFT_236032 [Irpex lacteus]